MLFSSVFCDEYNKKPLIARQSNKKTKNIFFLIFLLIKNKSRGGPDIGGAPAYP